MPLLYFVPLLYSKALGAGMRHSSLRGAAWYLAYAWTVPPGASANWSAKVSRGAASCLVPL